MNRRLILLVVMSLSLCSMTARASDSALPTQSQDTDSTQTQPPVTARAIFAGGCFWCMEPPFDALPGVISTTSGYIGGRVQRPSYEAVSAGRTGHTEAVEVVYDPATVSYETLLDVFWRNIDPVARDRQFCDVGSQYRSGIFYLDESQRAAAEASLNALQNSGQFAESIATEITAAGRFWKAESYHQDYYQKNPVRYRYYRWNCGRDQRLQELWGIAPQSH
ncbi:MAG: peptide-methionine (S)-S-oxide reductase MsrA [Pseudomonadales bacterium]|jgi:peptide-methionine (S)-S-oxide reductase